jgi:hypothetical protein
VIGAKTFDFRQAFELSSLRPALRLGDSPGALAVQSQKGALTNGVDKSQMPGGRLLAVIFYRQAAFDKRFDKRLV